MQSPHSYKICMNAFTTRLKLTRHLYTHLLLDIHHIQNVWRILVHALEISGTCCPLMLPSCAPMRLCASQPWVGTMKAYAWMHIRFTLMCLLWHTLLLIIPAKGGDSTTMGTMPRKKSKASADPSGLRTCCIMQLSYGHWWWLAHGHELEMIMKCRPCPTLDSTLTPPSITPATEDDFLAPFLAPSLKPIRHPFWYLSDSYSESVSVTVGVGIDRQCGQEQQHGAKEVQGECSMNCPPFRHLSHTQLTSHCSSAPIRHPFMTMSSCSDHGSFLTRCLPLWS